MHAIPEVFIKTKWDKAIFMESPIELALYEIKRSHVRYIFLMFFQTGPNEMCAAAAALLQIEAITASNND